MFYTNFGRDGGIDRLVELRKHHRDEEAPVVTTVGASVRITEGSTSSRPPWSRGPARVSPTRIERRHRPRADPLNVEVPSPLESPSSAPPLREGTTSVPFPAPSS